MEAHLLGRKISARSLGYLFSLDSETFVEMLRRVGLIHGISVSRESREYL